MSSPTLVSLLSTARDQESRVFQILSTIKKSEHQVKQDELAIKSYNSELHLLIVERINRQRELEDEQDGFERIHIKMKYEIVKTEVARTKEKMDELDPKVADYKSRWQLEKPKLERSLLTETANLRATCKNIKCLLDELNTTNPGSPTIVGGVYMLPCIGTSRFISTKNGTNYYAKKSSPLTPYGFDIIEYPISDDGEIRVETRLNTTIVEPFYDSVGQIRLRWAVDGESLPFDSDQYIIDK